MKTARILKFSPKKLVGVFALTVFALIAFRLVQVLAYGADELNFQGKLTDINGVNVSDGKYDFRVKIYDALTNGTAQVINGSNDYIDITDITVKNGIFNLKFSPSTSALSTGADRYLLVCFNTSSISLGAGDDGATGGSDGNADCGASSVYDKAFTPRKKITSSPYSLISKFLGSNNIQGDSSGSMTFSGVTGISVSSTGQGRIYFDSGANRFKCSESGGAYFNCFGAGLLSGSGTNNYLVRWTPDGNTLGASLIYDNGTTTAIGTTTTNAARLTVPWLAGDTTQTAYFGSTNTSNNQIAIRADSYSNYAGYFSAANYHGLYAGSSSSSYAAAYFSNISGGNAIYAANGNVNIGSFSSNFTRLGARGGSANTVAISGTVSVTNGSATVTGSSTAFTTELRVGDTIYIDGTYTVSSIASNTSLTLTSNYADGSASGITVSKDINLLSLQTGAGSTVFNVDKSGWLGIGTTTPVAPLGIGPNSGTSQTNNPTAVVFGNATGNVLGTAANSVVYMGEYRSAGTTNLMRLLTYSYRRTADGSWPGTGWRIQSAVDNSFTTYNTGSSYVEFSNNNALYLGTNGADRGYFNSSGLTISGGDLAFTAANPTISSSSYVTISGGASLSGTTYFDNTANFHGALQNDGLNNNGDVYINDSVQITNYLKMDTDTYISSNAAGHLALASHEYYNGSSWVGNGTAGSMIQINGQDVSVFEHNGSGTNTQSFKVSSFGNTFVRVQNQYSQRMCHSGSDGNNGTTLVTIGDCGATQADMAEYYGTSDASIQAADIISIDISRDIININHPTQGYTNKAWIKKAINTEPNSLMGIISTNPFGEILGEGVFDPSENPRPVALAGRVPVKVNTSNGDIHKGDLITVSSTAGVGMRATDAGFVVGKAMEDYINADPSIVGKIVVFVNNTYYNPANTGGTSYWTQSGTSISTVNNVIINGDITASKATFASIYANTLNIANGKITVDSAGNLTAAVINATNMTVKSLRVDKLAVNRTPATGDASIGSGVILAGTSSIVVSNTNITTNAKIFLTPKVATNQVLAVTSISNGVSFTVNISSNASINIPFDYWIVGE